MTGAVTGCHWVSYLLSLSFQTNSNTELSRAGDWVVRFHQWGGQLARAVMRHSDLTGDNSQPALISSFEIWNFIIANISCQTGWSESPHTHNYIQYNHTVYSSPDHQTGKLSANTDCHSPICQPSWVTSIPRQYQISTVKLSLIFKLKVGWQETGGGLLAAIYWKHFLTGPGRPVFSHCMRNFGLFNITNNSQLELR